MKGFLTVHQDLNILTRMNDICPHSIAIDNMRTVGYTLCMHTKYEEEIEILKTHVYRDLKIQQDAKTNSEGI